MSRVVYFKCSYESQSVEVQRVALVEFNISEPTVKRYCASLSV